MNLCTNTDNLFGGLLAISSKEVSDLHAQRVGDSMDVVETDIAFAAFDAADVGAIEFGQMGELFLAQAVLNPEFAHPAAEGGPLGELAWSGGRHASTLEQGGLSVHGL